MVDWVQRVSLVGTCCSIGHVFRHVTTLHVLYCVVHVDGSLLRGVFCQLRLNRGSLWYCWLNVRVYIRYRESVRQAVLSTCMSQHCRRMTGLSRCWHPIPYTAGAMSKHAYTIYHSLL